MKIGIIGSGIVGQVLARAFAAEGHAVQLGTRHPDKQELNGFRSANPGIPVVKFADAASAAELIVLSTKGDAVMEALALAGLSHFSYKTVIDTTNPIAATPPVNGVLSFFTGPNESLLEKIQALIPDAKVVKAFNSVGNALMYKPKLSGGAPTMFICGNDAEAKKTVTEILSSFGWDTADMGAAEAARAIEPLCMLWCIPGFISNDWVHAFKLLKA